jgi:tRNA dimethylallyltransferase
MSQQWTQGTEKPLEGYDMIRIGLDPPREALRERIAQRSERMFKIGLLDEVGRLLKSGVSRDAWPLGSLGYRQALAHLEGKLTLDQAIEETTTLTRRYAKRQMTWFRREPDVQWFAGFGDDPGIVDAAQDRLRSVLAVYIQ